MREARLGSVSAVVLQSTNLGLRYTHHVGTHQNRLASLTTAVPPCLVPLGCDCDFVRRRENSNNSDASDFDPRLLGPTAAEPSKDSET